MVYFIRRTAASLADGAPSCPMPLSLPRPRTAPPGAQRAAPRHAQRHAATPGGGGRGAHTGWQLTRDLWSSLHN